MKYDNIELLAPAGCYPSLMAGIHAGADAVYFGLQQLNMRARARKSFSLEDLEEISKRCSQHNVKSYLTLNTLLYEHDIKMAKQLIDKAKKYNITGIIAADMAAITYANQIGLEVHISTQLSISNYQSFAFYAQFSDRIVLARELNLTMIKQIHRQIIANNLRGPSGKLMEIEAFAHGALCIAISGRCGMSLFTSNASANRGACEQNCRKEYVVTDKETGKQLAVDNQFIMSPNDIATIDFLDQLLDSGVNVLKIEGRGRSPEYVATVINAYRQAIDAIQNGTYNQKFVEKLYRDMQKVYNRGLSSGYYLGKEQGWAKTYGSKATRQKVYLGDVTNFFKKIKVAEIKVVAGKINLDDEFVIIGETTGVVKGKANEIRLQDGSNTKVAQKNDICSLKLDKIVRRNDKLYLMKELVK